MLAAAKFEAMPYGGFAGEMLLSPPAAPPAAPAPAGLVIEPPDWAAEERERRERGLSQNVAEPARPLGGAVSEMMAAAQERGELEEPRALGPAVLPLPPLRRPVLPEPDWRAEERERARLAREQAGEPALAEEQPSGYPPLRRQSA
jgi:hypothetical protein